MCACPGRVPTRAGDARELSRRTRSRRNAGALAARQSALPSTTPASQGRATWRAAAFILDQHSTRRCQVRFLAATSLETPGGARHLALWTACPGRREIGVRDQAEHRASQPSRASAAPGSRRRQAPVAHHVVARTGFAVPGAAARPSRDGDRDPDHPARSGAIEADLRPGHQHEHLERAVEFQGRQLGGAMRTDRHAASLQRAPRPRVRAVIDANYRDRQDSMGNPRPIGSSWRRGRTAIWRAVEARAQVSSGAARDRRAPPMRQATRARHPGCPDLAAADPAVDPCLPGSCMSRRRRR